MGILAKIFGAVSREEMNGIRINLKEPLWEVEGKTDFSKVFSGLADLLPANSILYFEGGSPPKDILNFLSENSGPEKIHVAYGTIWPRPQTFHVLASAQNLQKLADLMCSRVYPELAIHFHVYCEDKILLQWYDAFTQPMLLSNKFSSETIEKVSNSVGMKPHLYQPKTKTK